MCPVSALGSPSWFPLNTRNQLILLGLVFVVSSILDFVDLALNALNTHPTPCRLNFFVAHLPTATISQAGN